MEREAYVDYALSRTHRRAEYLAFLTHHKPPAWTGEEKHLIDQVQVTVNWFSFQGVIYLPHVPEHLALTWTHTGRLTTAAQELLNKEGGKYIRPQAILAARQSDEAAPTYFYFPTIRTSHDAQSPRELNIWGVLATSDLTASEANRWLNLHQPTEDQVEEPTEATSFPFGGYLRTLQFHLAAGNVPLTEIPPRLRVAYFRDGCSAFSSTETGPCSNVIINRIRNRELPSWMGTVEDSLNPSREARCGRAYNMRRAVTVKQEPISPEEQERDPEAPGSS